MAKPKHQSDRYADGVLSGKIPASRWTRLAVQRHVNDLKDGHKRGLVFMPNAGQHVIEFFKYLRHSKGEWAGRVVDLEPWQKFCLMVLFGWYREDGTRRFRTAYTEVPRKNGKSLIASGVGLYMLAGDGEPGAEVYSAATTRPQAKIVHSEAQRMVQSSPMLKTRIQTFKDNLSIAGTASKYEPLSSDFGTLDGLNIHCCILDEVHAFATSGLSEKIRTAVGARRQPLIFQITTAGISGETVGWHEHRYAQGVLDGGFADDSYYAMIYCADENDDPFAELTQRRANPNFGVSVKPSMLKEAAMRAENQPSMYFEYTRYHLDLWSTTSRRWIDLNVWDACPVLTGPNELAGQECYVGLDLSQTTDLTACCWLFPPAGERLVWTAMLKCYVPSERMRERVQKDRVPYDLWVKQGFITATPGNVVDYEKVRADINEMSKRFIVKEIGFDPWNSSQIAIQLAGDGFVMTPVRQGYRTLSEPTKFLEGLVLSKELDHQANPVMRWCMGNVELASDPSGNVKADKSRSVERIDGVVALICALSRAIVEIGGTSVYEERGLRVL